VVQVSIRNQICGWREGCCKNGVQQGTIPVASVRRAPRPGMSRRKSSGDVANSPKAAQLYGFPVDFRLYLTSH
jgi:hypothetical protein